VPQLASVSAPAGPNRNRFDPTAEVGGQTTSDGPFDGGDDALREAAGEPARLRHRPATSWRRTPHRARRLHRSLRPPSGHGRRAVISPKL